MTAAASRCPYVILGIGSRYAGGVNSYHDASMLDVAISITTSDPPPKNARVSTTHTPSPHNYTSKITP